MAVKKMNDDEVMNYVYGKLFGDLDRMESKSMNFDEGGEGAVEGAVDNAKPESKESGGMKITIEPLMAGAQEGGRRTADVGTTEEDDEENDRLKGIGGMSPLMAQLHGER